MRSLFGAGGGKVVIGGDGDKRILLEEAIEIHGLQSRVEMLGELSHSGMTAKILKSINYHY